MLTFLWWSKPQERLLLELSFLLLDGRLISFTLHSVVRILFSFGQRPLRAFFVDESVNFLLHIQIIIDIYVATSEK